jgi:myo-inositol-1(or 4)-monophosphatase
MPMDIDLFCARTTAVAAAETAGKFVRDRLFRDLTIHEKGSHGDVVTNLDFAAEKLIIGIIREQFPDHRVISEELGDTGKGSPWTWLVDPVDGTNNIAIGLPVLTVGITLCRREIPVVSVVHDPVSERTWSAILAKGAWDNCGPLASPAESSADRKPLLAWTQGYSVGKDDRTARALRMVVASAAHRVLDLWAPLTCWVMLIRGDIDGIIGYRVGEIDLYSGTLMAVEVGLTVQEFSGDPFVSRLRGISDDQCILAGSARVVTELAGMVSTARRVELDLERFVVSELRDGSL